MRGPYKLAYNESLVTFVEPLTDIEHVVVGISGFVFLLTCYNAVKLRAATNALNNPPKSVRVSVAFYTCASTVAFVPLVLAMLQIGAPSYAVHTLAQASYCASLGVRVCSFVLR
jgi:hypothetical protein